jgi:hypothetical protein
MNNEQKQEMIRLMNRHEDIVATLKRGNVTPEERDQLDAELQSIETTFENI